MRVLPPRRSDALDDCTFLLRQWEASRIGVASEADTVIWHPAKSI